MPTSFFIMYVKKKNFLPFKQARKLARTLGLKREIDWVNYCRGRTHLGPRDPRLPVCPDMKYRKSGWKSWGDWLDVDNSRYREKNYLPYAQARRLVHSFGFKNKNDWERFHAKLKKGNEYTGKIPLSPPVYYGRRRQWKGWPDWLGRETIRREFFLPYKSVKKIVQSLGIKSEIEWRRYPKKKLPPGVPRSPQDAYTRRGEWISWGDFFGTGNEWRLGRKHHGKKN
ncbi:MAG: hypothetical protein JW780_06080 [Clostridiales bacterium]|nr:hypothetical protein [Clostridiales bacterium]